MENPLTTIIFLIATVGVTLVYAFLNGMNGSGGLVAAAISSRALTPHAALTLASLAEFVGPFLFGTAVAATIGKELVQADALSVTTLFIAITSAIVWGALAQYLGIPSSSTHALLGGLIGAVVVARGVDALLLDGFARVLLALFAAPIFGMVVGYVFMHVVQWLTRNATPRINIFFKRVQILNVIALSLSSGTNDGQKSMGLIALALVMAHRQDDFQMPLWVVVSCAFALTLGVRMGGWRVIRTMGESIYRLRPVHAFTAQTAATLIVMGTALLGSPVSISQVVSTAIIGVGSAYRLSAVRWLVAHRIVTTWVITMPASAGMAMLAQLVFLYFGLR